MKKPKKNSGIEAARRLRGRRRGGKEERPDGLDRSAPGTLPSLADLWIERLETLAYSPRTLDMNRWTLKSFLQWAQERGIAEPAELDRPRLQSYQRWLARHRQKNGLPLAVRTQRQRLGSLRRFFAWLCREGLLPANPAADLDLPRQPARLLPRGLPRDELARLLAVPDTEDPLGIRDRAILETLYATGARRTELCRLQLPDLDPRARTLHIKDGKGGKERLVPVGKTALKWIDRYLLQCRPLLSDDPAEQTLFLTGYGEGFAPAALANLVKKMMKAAGIDRPGSCHLLRHTAATHLLEGGAPLRLIQQFLGHSKADTTALYTQVAIAELRAAYDRAHPSAQRGAGSLPAPEEGQ